MLARATTSMPLVGASSTTKSGVGLHPLGDATFCWLPPLRVRVKVVAVP